MLASKIWNYIKGYVIIIVEGVFIEKFINISVHRRIFLWDLEKKDRSSTVMKTGIKSFKRIRPAARGAKCRVRILKKCGLPFLFSMYRGRKFFVLGVLLFAGIFNVFAMFVWDINVEGAGDNDTVEIVKILDDMGIRLGTFKYKVDTDSIANMIMIEMERLAWCGAELRGTKLSVRVKKRSMPPDVIPVDIPCNIVARVDGLIESMDVKSGQEMVKPGDIVRRGQVLVSGIIESRNEAEDVMFVHAMASIKARTWYEGVAETGSLITENEPTGREKTIYYLDMFGNKMNISLSKSSFEQYELTRKVKRFTIGSDLVLPFGVVTENYTEYRIATREIDESEKKRIAGDNAYKKALSGVSEVAQIVGTELNFEKTGEGRMKARVLIECLEDIGTEQMIGGS